MHTPDEHDDDLESEVIEGSASETGIETETFAFPDADDVAAENIDDEPVEPTDDLSDEGADSL